MPNLRDVKAADQLKRAREYILAHPLESKMQQQIGSGTSERTIARARAELTREGKFIQVHDRLRMPKAPPPMAQGEPEPAEPETPAAESPKVAPKEPAAGKTSYSMLDSDALTRLADMVDVAVDSGDDEGIHRMLLKQCLTFAFRADLHPDTRMSASQLWAKLKDMAKAKDLGPGKPKTFADGVARLKELLTACGPTMVLAAVHEAFEVTTDAAKDDEGPPPGGTQETPGPAGHQGDPAPAQVVRQIDEGGARGREDNGDHDLPGPTPGWPGPPGDPRTPPHADGSNPWS